MTVIVFFVAVCLGLAGPAASSPQQEVLAAMQSFKNAWMHGDREALARLLGADLNYVDADGAPHNRNDALGFLTAAPHPVQVEFLPDTTVRISGDTALVIGHEDVWDTRAITHLHTLHVWEKSPRGWQLELRQATLIGIQTRNK